MEPTASTAVEGRWDGDGGDRDLARLRGEQALDDRTPLEGAIARLDQAIGSLGHAIDEHSERITVVMRGVIEVKGEEATPDRPATMASERTAQVTYLAERVEALGEYMRSLTQRIDA